MFATSHYMEGMKAEKDDVIKKLDTLRIRLESEGIRMPLYSGHELFIDHEAAYNLYEGKVLTLNDSRYVLVELPMMHQINKLNDILFDLVMKGFVPIIAHPERYAYIQKDLDIARGWVNKGFLLQVNLPTFYGKYGEDAKKTAIKMLKRHMYHFVGTDVHSARSTALSIAAPLSKIREIVGESVYEDMVQHNPECVVYNKAIEPFKIKEVEFSLLDMIRNRIG